MLTALDEVAPEAKKDIAYTNIIIHVDPWMTPALLKSSKTHANFIMPRSRIIKMMHAQLNMLNFGTCSTNLKKSVNSNIIIIVGCWPNIKETFVRHGLSWTPLLHGNPMLQQ